MMVLEEGFSYFATVLRGLNQLPFPRIRGSRESRTGGNECNKDSAY